MELGCFMTPGLSKDIRCHVWPYCFKQYGAGREVGGFGHFMTPRLNKDSIMDNHTVLNSMVQRGRDTEGRLVDLGCHVRQYCSEKYGA